MISHEQRRILNCLVVVPALIVIAILYAVVQHNYKDENGGTPALSLNENLSTPEILALNGETLYGNKIDQMREYGRSISKTIRDFSDKASNQEAEISDLEPFLRGIYMKAAAYPNVESRLSYLALLSAELEKTLSDPKILSIAQTEHSLQVVIDAVKYFDIEEDKKLKEKEEAKNKDTIQVIQSLSFSQVVITFITLICLLFFFSL